MHGHGADHGPGLAGHLEVDDALAAARLQAIEVHPGPLAVAVGGNGHDLRGLIAFLENDPGHHEILTPQGNALDARGHAAHGTHIPAGKADGDAVGRGQHNMAVLTDGTHDDQLVVLAQPHGHETGLAAAGIQRRRRALDHAPPRHKEKILVFGKLAQSKHRRHPLAFFQRQQVVDMHALGGAAAFGHLMHLQLVHASLVGKKAEILMIRRRQKFLHIIVLGRVQGGDALAAALLLLVVFQRRPLHVAAAGQSDHHLVIGDEILDINAVEGFGHHFRTARRGEGVPDFRNFALHFAAQHIGIFQNGLVEFNLLQQVLVLVHELVALQTRQTLQAHVKNGAGLHLGEGKTLHQSRTRRIGIRRRTDERNHLVDVINGQPQTFQNMGAGFGLAQIEAGAPYDHLAAMIHKAGQSRLEIEQHRTIVHHGQHVDAEARFQRRILVQLVDDNLGNDAALEIDHNADALAVGLVPQVHNAVNLALVHQRRNLFHQTGFVESEGNFPDDDGLQALLALFHLHAAAHLHGAASRAVGVVQALARIDKARRREVRPLDEVHQVLDAALRMLQQIVQRVAEFPQVVRRNIGGHAYGNTGRTVEQQVGHLGRKHGRFLQRIVIVGQEIDGFLIQIRQKLACQTRHAHFGVTHGGGGVAVQRAEVALPVHQRIAHGKILRHAHKRVVYRRVAVRVILTDNVADDAGRLLVRPVVAVGKLVLREHNAPVHGLQAVARIGNGASYDDRKRVFQIGLTQFLLNADFRLCVFQLLRHGASVCKNNIRRRECAPLAARVSLFQS